MRFLIYLIALVLVVSCSDVKYLDRPEDFYGDDKMADILTDLYLMEAAMTTDRGMFTDLKVLPNEYIYKKYDTDSLTFKENLFYYSDNVEDYQVLMEKVKEKMNVIKDSITVREQRDLKKKEEMYRSESEPLRDPDDLPEN
ncbi:DUF4296 domain-containing protein [Nonlabens marinus]|uniref:DUF4296 domain-containing protein n=1 Tax=Nonlabens marinus TaxID=930802 RepID=UPI0005A161A0|nr:DUF4296 domain-containing protein [Nonlabens marinus]